MKTHGCVKIIATCLLLAGLSFQVGCHRLHGAVKRNNVQAVQELLKNNPDVNATDDDGYTPLMHAAKNNYPEIAKILINAGADINARDTREGMTALMIATWYGHPDFAQLMIENNADVNLKDNGGWTALIDAACVSPHTLQHAAIAKLLVEKGAGIKQSVLVPTSSILDVKVNGKEEYGITELSSGEYNLTVSFDYDSYFSNNTLGSIVSAVSKKVTTQEILLDVKDNHIYCIAFEPPTSQFDGWSAWIEEFPPDGEDDETEP